MPTLEAEVEAEAEAEAEAGAEAGEEAEAQWEEEPPTMVTLSADLLRRLVTNPEVYTAVLVWESLSTMMITLMHHAAARVDFENATTP